MPETRSALNLVWFYRIKYSLSDYHFTCCNTHWLFSTNAHVPYLHILQIELKSKFKFKSFPHMRHWFLIQNEENSSHDSVFEWHMTSQEKNSAIAWQKSGRLNAVWMPTRLSLFAVRPTISRHRTMLVWPQQKSDLLYMVMMIANIWNWLNE